MAMILFGISMIALISSVVFSIFFAGLNIPFVHPYVTVTWGLQVLALLLFLIGCLVDT